jgi:hypothetical protein
MNYITDELPKGLGLGKNLQSNPLAITVKRKITGKGISYDSN